MTLIKRLISKEREGPDMIVTLSVSGMTSPFSAKQSARARAILEAGLNVPKSLKKRERITKVEDSDLERIGPANYEGEVVVRVRNA